MEPKSMIRMSSTGEDSSTDRVTCRLCRRQFAKYTCPTCNVPYCSLTCFRSQAHNQCSEGFYKKEIETDIHSGPSRSLKERQQMIELLKNFEEEVSADQPLQAEEEGDDEDLAKRLGSVNLELTSSEELWALLTPAERSKFVKVFDDATSELAQKLLSSEQLEKETREPWWEAPNNDEDSEEDAAVQILRRGRQYGHRPTFMDIPELMVKPFALEHPLIYNICAICVSYAYITRHLGTSPLSELNGENPDYHEARRLITQMVPFLADRKSTLVYPNLPAVITDIWSKFDLGIMTSDLFALLLRDSSRLVKPLLVTQVACVSPGTLVSEKTISAAHPHSMSILVLSDLFSIYANGQANTSQDKLKVPKHNHICHKLVFYTAYILSMPSVILNDLADELTIRAKEYRV